MGLPKSSEKRINFRNRLGHGWQGDFWWMAGDFVVSCVDLGDWPTEICGGSGLRTGVVEQPLSGLLHSPCNFVVRQEFDVSVTKCNAPSVITVAI